MYLDSNKYRMSNLWSVAFFIPAEWVKEDSELWLIKSKCLISWVSRTSEFLTQSFPEHRGYKSLMLENKHKHKMNKHDQLMSRYICNLITPLYPSLHIPHFVYQRFCWKKKKLYNWTLTWLLRLGALWGFGNQPGEAADATLSQRWISSFSLGAAGGWQCVSDSLGSTRSRRTIDFKSPSIRSLIRSSWRFNQREICVFNSFNCTDRLFFNSQSTSGWATVLSIMLERKWSTWKTLSAIQWVDYWAWDGLSWVDTAKVIIDVSWEIVRKAGNLNWYQCFRMWLNSLDVAIVSQWWMAG